MLKAGESLGKITWCCNSSKAEGRSWLKNMGEESHNERPNRDLCLWVMVWRWQPEPVWWVWATAALLRIPVGLRQVKGMCGCVLPYGHHPSGSRSREGMTGWNYGLQLEKGKGVEHPSPTLGWLWWEAVARQPGGMGWECWGRGLGIGFGCSKDAGAAQENAQHGRETCPCPKHESSGEDTMSPRRASIRWACEQAVGRDEMNLCSPRAWSSCKPLLSGWFLPVGSRWELRWPQLLAFNKEKCCLCWGWVVSGVTVGSGWRCWFLREYASYRGELVVVKWVKQSHSSPKHCEFPKESSAGGSSWEGLPCWAHEDV